MELTQLKSYLVGGAVRDYYLNLPLKDRDYVVTGETPESMIERGFKPVGKDFPVFLHPHTHEEYALARTERKSGHGYRGFTFYTSPNLKIEEDLIRRDLTINAMALDHQNQLIDPYGGLDDLNNRILRHVSPAFAEDPLRVLRLARFKAKFHSFGFEIAEETKKFARQIAAQGELEFLTPERIWLETEKALELSDAAVYFDTLRELGALKVLFPEIDALFGVPQRAEYHPEIDTGIHTLLSLKRACQLNFPVAVRWAALVHDLGKALTPSSEWPKHVMHEKRGIEPVKAIGNRLKIPADFQRLALAVCRDHILAHQGWQLKPKTLWKLLHRLDVLRRPEQFEMFLQACQSDAQGRLGLENKPYTQGAYLRQAAQTVRQLETAAILQQGKEKKRAMTGNDNLSGEEIARLFEHARIEALTSFKQYKRPEFVKQMANHSINYDNKSF